MYQGARNVPNSGRTGRKRVVRASRRNREDPTTNRWLSTYADMVTVLLAFFVLLYSMSEIDLAKFQAFVSGLAVPDGDQIETLEDAEERAADDTVERDGELADTDEQLLAELDQAVDDPVLDASDPESQDRPAAPRREAGEVTETALPQLTRESLPKFREQLDELLDDAGMEDTVTVVEDQRGVAVVITTDDVLFDLGSAQLTSRGQDVIAGVAPVLTTWGNQVLVEGHTDVQPMRREDYTNWNLSTDRAVAVVHQLIDEHQLQPFRLAATGYSEYHPRDADDTPAAWARNRRVELVIVIPET